MKQLIALLLISILSFQMNGQTNDTTTYYLIRHAEKDRSDSSNKNPDLNEKGKLRAEYWKTVFQHIDFDLIYTTKYNRTIQTVTPIATSKNIEIQFYNPRDLYNEEFQTKTKGKTVLIVGHSNTTPIFVNKILEDKKYPLMDDLNYSNLYIVTKSNSSINDILLTIHH